jgi:GNAT superfamily N-acetyltransferase
MSQALSIHGVLRHLKDADLAEFIAHLLRLDAASRHDRFQGGMSDMAVMLYGERALQDKSLTVGYFIEGKMRGAAELKIADGMSELAFSVEKDFQGKGLGTALMGRILIIARLQGLKDVQLSFLQGNDAMRHLAGKFGASVKGTVAKFTL